VPETHRRLPHWGRDNAAYFVSWQLYGSLPLTKVADRWTTAGAKFVHEDKLLDAASTGPKWLIEPEVAQLVVRVLHQGVADGEYELGSWVLMPNHVHLVIRPSLDLPAAVRSIKGRTARPANQFLNRSGQPFWARDYFDRWIRDRHEEERINKYIVHNPVKAGLCSVPETWRWSSAQRG
jgi:REP element-mobilizing transposase RayT